MESDTGGITYKISLSGDGLSVEREIDQRQALAILNIVVGGIGHTASLGHAGRRDAQSFPLGVSEGSEPRDPPLSLREYVHEKSPNTNPEVITTIAQYLKEVDGRQDFGRDDIQSNFAPAGLHPPKNYGRDFKNAIQNGWIAEYPGQPNRYYVTRTGETAVNNGFPKDARRTSLRPRRRVSKKAETSSQSEE